MKKTEQDKLKEICYLSDNDATKMMDIVIAVQKEFGAVTDDAIDYIAGRLDINRVEVESVVSFYSFLSKEPRGKIVIRLCNDIIDKMAGYKAVASALENKLGIKMGETTEDGRFTIENTACIGMCDQAPAALVNDVVVTKLTSTKINEMIDRLSENEDPQQLVDSTGEGNNSHPLVKSMVENNIRLRGPVIFADFNPGNALINTLAMSPIEVIRSIKTARLRGRGGAGFPAGMKWEFARNSEGAQKYIICNADEGEPGTFKDRALLTEKPHLVFEGMTIAGYAIGATKGIVYLRGEYAYLKPFLEKVIRKRRKKGLIGENIYSKNKFEFDISIQLGAGAYICGEETSLISSCEGLRGDPKNRPPFPAQRGYLGMPTVVNNVETFCCVAKIMEKGAGWFAQRGTTGSTGTKLLSISGDCEIPGVYEIPFGMKIEEVLRLVGAFDTMAVQIGGPSGQLISREDFEKTICYDDVPTGGAFMIFDSRRNLLDIVHSFMDFFVEESCGYCTPCRAGNVLLMERLEKIMAGTGTPEDLDYLEELGNSIKLTSRCGLGQTSPNPILTSLQNFRKVYEDRVKDSEDAIRPSFDINSAISESSKIAGRKSEIFVL